MEKIFNQKLKFTFVDIDNEFDDYFLSLKIGACTAYEMLKETGDIVCTHCGVAGAAISACVPDDGDKQKAIGGREGYTRALFYPVCAECLNSETCSHEMSQKVIQGMKNTLLH